MTSKKVLLINGVADGGITYAESLKFVSQSLPDDVEVESYNIPAQTKMSASEVENITGLATKDVEVRSLPLLSKRDFGTIFSNDATIGPCIDSSIKTVFVAHGSAPLPACGEFFYADVLAYFDMVTVSARSNMRMAVSGMSDYRARRRSLALGVSGPVMRTDMRDTAFMPVSPIKEQPRHTEPQSIVPKAFTIGIMPTSIAAIQTAVSLYNNLIDIIQVLFETFPECRIVFRPYPFDLNKPDIKKLCEILEATGGVSIDIAGRAASEFHKECDLLITDGSTGGISFMLRKTVPPIYFVPSAALGENITRLFVENMRDCVPIVHSTDEMAAAIYRLVNAQPSDIFRYYDDYFEKELFLRASQKEYFRSILGECDENEDTIHVDAFGVVHEHALKAVA